MKLLSAKSYENHHGVRPLTELAEGTRTLVRNPVNNKWNDEPSEVTSQTGLRSYVIRNRRQLKPVFSSKVNRSRCEVSSQSQNHSRRDVQDEILEEIPSVKGHDFASNIRPGDEESQTLYQTRSGLMAMPKKQLDL